MWWIGVQAHNDRGFPKWKHTDLDALTSNCTVKAGQDKLNDVKLYKYLGVEIDNLLAMKQHAKTRLSWVRTNYTC